MSLTARSSSPFLTSVLLIGTSPMERSSSGYLSCSMAKPPSSGRTRMRYCLPRAAHCPRAIRPLERFELLRREQHVLPLRELVPLDPVVILHLLPVLGADVLLLQAGAVFLVKPVEGDGCRGFAGREEFHRHGHETEGYGGGTDGMSAHKRL